MIDTREDRPLRLQSDKLILEELLDELMIYDPARNRAFCLSQTAAFVWRHADGKTTVAEIAALMAQHLDKPVNEQVVWFALEVLAKDGLLAPSTVLAAAEAGVTRRDLLQKFGMGAAVAVPLVTAMLVSPAKAHASSMRMDSSDWKKSWENGPNPIKHKDWSNSNGKDRSGVWNWF